MRHGLAYLTSMRGGAWWVLWITAVDFLSWRKILYCFIVLRMQQLRHISKAGKIKMSELLCSVVFRQNTSRVLKTISLPHEVTCWRQDRKGISRTFQSHWDHCGCQNSWLNFVPKYAKKIRLHLGNKRIKEKTLICQILSVEALQYYMYKVNMVSE